MQFTPRSRRQFNLTGRRDSALYPHSLQFYKYPPLDTITLEQFEELALERLKVLRLIERAGAKHNKSSQDYRDMIISELKKQKLHFYYKITVPKMAITDEIYDERRRDHISHFILRLAYCRREDLRRWFINQEVDLFRFRFISEQTQSRKLFMDLNNLKYEPIKPEEKEDIFENLCLGHCNPAKARSIDFYKVPFVEVLDLIKNRKVFLKKGFAYIPEDDMVITIASAYRAHLSHSLAITSRALPQLEEDTRLISMLSTLHQRYIGTDYSNRKVDYTGDITPELIDGLSKTSFPLCMQNLHETLRRNHHLKYNGRLQYGLFLKGIGLTLEDALRFWRQEFTKIMDNDKFDKQYAYNIRYNYGKEGKRANFSPYSCVKIITSNTPGPGEFHGCPFKHSDESNLKQRLQNLHISSSGISNFAYALQGQNTIIEKLWNEQIPPDKSAHCIGFMILDLAKRGHYQIACTRYFELTHQEASIDQGISHPNQYFEESQKIRKGINKDQKRSTASLNSTQSSVSNTSQVSSKKNDTQADEDVFNDMENMDELLHCLEGV